MAPVPGFVKDGDGLSFAGTIDVSIEGKSRGQICARKSLNYKSDQDRNLFQNSFKQIELSDILSKEKNSMMTKLSFQIWTQSMTFL